ncbi:MAG: hypothetical protein AB1726_07470 [Planctomycetota bacterium]
MKNPSRLPPARLALLLFAGSLLLGGACETVTTGGPARPEAALPPGWTDTFLTPAFLVADEIAVEGPADLLTHVAIAQDTLHADYATKTTERGLVQEVTLRDESAGVEIRAQLDAWDLRALRRLVVLQRPGEVPVRVRAAGNAWWCRADGSQEVRREILEFQGVRGR